MSEPAPSILARRERSQTEELAPLGWPWVALEPIDDHPVVRQLIGSFGLVLGGSAGMIAGGCLGAALAYLLKPMFPAVAELVLISLTLSTLAAGAVIGRRVLQRETFE